MASSHLAALSSLDIGHRDTAFVVIDRQSALLTDKRTTWPASCYANKHENDTTRAPKVATDGGRRQWPPRVAADAARRDTVPVPRPCKSVRWQGRWSAASAVVPLWCVLARTGTLACDQSSSRITISPLALSSAS